MTDLPESKIARKREELRLREQKAKLEEGLPHLYGQKFYKWQRDFFESRNKINLLTAANQVGKSTINIRKAIHWATSPQLWPALWPGLTPNQFWYLYPTGNQVRAEFETKWKPLLPQNEFKHHPIYGWKDVWVNKELFAIQFNSGVGIYFKTYAQKTEALQTGTVFALFPDEEIPVEHYDELMFRISASKGYFNMVFTATMGQEFWRLCMEPGATEEERLPDAKKWTVSLYDCKFYEDGTPSHWDDEAIQIVKNRCKDENEILKRVYGRFVLSRGGRKYEQFDIKRHMKAAHPIPKEWLIYCGADPGSGGEENHPAALCYVAVRPDFKAGRVFIGWRGDGIETTAGDVVKKHIELKKQYNLTLADQRYDWGSRDFFNIATSMGEPFNPADKSHEKGEEVINVLFKNDMLFVYETDELQKLASELTQLRKDTPKRKAKDDLADALRYCVTTIPWDWSAVTALSASTEEPKIVEERQKTAMEIEIDERRKDMRDGPEEEVYDVEAELQEFNELYGE
jgi:hypothetical protein